MMWLWLFMGLISPIHAFEMLLQDLTSLSRERDFKVFSEAQLSYIVVKMLQINTLADINKLDRASKNKAWCVYSLGESG